MKDNKLKKNVVLLSVIVGLVSGLAAIILKNLIDITEKWARILHRQNPENLLFYFLPLIGLALSLIIIRVLCNGHLEKGLSHVMYLFAKKSSKIPAKNMYGHVLTSAVTIGFGGSAGLEAPIVFTGAAIGSNIAQQAKTDYTIRTLLSACGAAAGIAAIFNAPIGGVIFAFEVLLPQLSVPYLVPLLLASASASVLSKFFYTGLLFSTGTEGWVFPAIPFYILLGVFCGLLSIYIIKVTITLETLARKIPSKLVKLLLGGGLLALLIFLLLPLYGEGYSTIRLLLQGRENAAHIPGGWISAVTNQNLILICLSILVLKPIATSLTNTGGGNGGIIAPSLFLGAIAGFLFTEVLLTAGLITLNTKNFMLAGMVGILSGVVHAPLSAIFIIAELTGGYALFIPLMLVSAISYFISKTAIKDSIYTLTLKRDGIKFRGDVNKNVLNQIAWESVLDTDFIILEGEKTLRQVIPDILRSKRNLFVVKNRNGEFAGLLYLEDIRETLTETEYLDIILVAEIARMNTPIIPYGTSMDDVLNLFDKDKHWQYPVLMGKEYVGMISRANLINTVFTLEHDEKDVI